MHIRATGDDRGHVTAPGIIRFGYMYCISSLFGTSHGVSNARLNNQEHCALRETKIMQS